MYTLCVIDMQPYFGINPTSELADNIEREIHQAMKDDAGIIFVEYTGCGNTIGKLVKPVKDAQYAAHQFVYKNQTDGSQEIMSVIKNRNFTIDHLKITGVNTDCCVLTTASGLRSDLPQSTIEVIADACSTCYPWGHDSGIYRMRQLGCLISNYNPVASPPAI